MRVWTAEEMNMFFTIIAKIKNEGTKEITLSTEEIKKIIKFKRREKDRWEKILIGVSEKISDLKYRYEDERYYRIMPLFKEFEIDKKNKTLKVAVDERFDYILNQLDINFTYYKLEEFIDVKSTYSKTAYRLFKQWKTIGKIKYEIEEFKEKFSVPESYNISSINRAIIKPIMNELQPYFKNLKVKKIKANTRGTPVIGYEFTWKPEKTGKYIEGKYEKHSEESVTIQKEVPIFDWTKQ